MTIRRLLSFVLPALFAVSALAQLNITSERYDNNRLGANLAETTLNTGNVGVNTFGKLWSYTISGSTQAQPLYVQAVNIPGVGTKNVLYVATMNDIVYAFDADSSVTLWMHDFTNTAAGITPVPITDIVGSNNLNVVGNVGITSTPVIDLATNTMYLVARTKENGSYFQRIHALDITTGADKVTPTVISASVPGTGPASVNGTLTFDPLLHNQRSSLALAGGQVWIAWASHEDYGPYHGWVMTYDTTTLAQTGVFCVVPNGAMGGTWMAGRAPVVDSAGNVYYITGNGDWDGNVNFGESFLKFSSANHTLALLDWFTPDNYSSLNGGDTDLGASGPMLIPGTNLLVGGGKQSLFYLLNTGSLGHEQSGNGQIPQVLNNAGGEIKGGPVYWNRSGGAGPWMYEWANNDYLKAYHFNGSTFDASTVSRSNILAASGSSGGVLTLSANGSTSGTGIVWSSMPLNQDGDHGTVQGVLRALNADDLTKEIWNSNINASRDNPGLWPKYSPPVVANGRVYLGSFSGVVNVYGLLPTTPDFTIGTSTGQAAVNPGSSTNVTVNIGQLFGFTGTVALTSGTLPTGITASFTPSSVVTPGSSTLKLSAASNAAGGSFNITIKGTSGALSHSTTLSLIVTAIAPGHGLISINFVGNGTAMAATERAGAVGRANWNQAPGASSSSPLALLDENGAATGATAMWSSTNGWALPITDTAGNARMMRGYLDTVGANATVTVSGLPAITSGYTVYVFADGDNGGATRKGTYQISGPGFATKSLTLTDNANTNFSGTFTRASNSAGNYVVWTGLPGTSFTVTSIPGTASDGTPRAPINGIQVVPTVYPGHGVMSVDFVGRDVAMAATETAGVLAKANWNAASGSNSSSPLALMDETGTFTGATLTWTSSPVWSLPITDAPGNARMMDGYLDTVGQNTVLTAAGLPTRTGGYDLYVYCDGDNGGATRTGNYQISGTGITTQTISCTDNANTNFSGTFKQANNSAGNYVKFTFNATGFTLTAIPGTASDGVQRAPVNGLQINPK